MSNPETVASIIERIKTTIGKPNYAYLKRLPLTDRLTLADDLTIEVARTTLAERLRVPTLSYNSLENALTPMMTQTEAAEFLGISVPALIGHIKRGNVTAIKKGRTVLLNSSDVLNFQLRRTRQAKTASANT